MPVIEAATSMLALLDTFAESNSNAVLDVLAGQIPKQDEKFPHGELHFAGSGWRGFYHCHAMPDRDEHEHGHFHLFARCGEGDDRDEDWSHVAGLSMDVEGQPLVWFTVNQWVTSGSWLSAKELKHFLDNITVSGNLSLTEQWLMTMLLLYSHNLYVLLTERDRLLIQINADNDLTDTLANRNIYMLSYQPIDLKNTLLDVLE